MKKALVLAGGGTRGSYQNGAIHALRRLGKDDWDIVVGTSIGALNGVLVVQKDYAEMDQLWHTLTQDRILNGELSLDRDLGDLLNDRDRLLPFVKEFLRDHGADVRPMMEYISRMYCPERFFESPVDFGCMVCRRDRSPVYVTKEMMKEHGADWLISSASAYPAFPVHKFEAGEFIDGGYYDNLPVDFALRLGAEEVIAIDLSSNPHHPNYFGRSGFTTVFPRVETGTFLSFDQSVIRRLETLGYYDTMKVFGMFDGVRYTFEKMELPAWYRKFTLDFLILEEKIRRANEITNRLFSASAVTDRIASQQHARTIDDRQLFFGFMDNLMSLCGLKTEQVWTYREARNAVLAGFAECASEDYSCLPEKLSMDHLVSYASSMSTRGVVEKIMHTLLYPSHAFVSEGILLTVYPFEYALALFLDCLMQELKCE